MHSPSEILLRQTFVGLLLAWGRNCAREEKARWRARYPEKPRQAMKSWRDKNPDKWKVIAKRSKKALKLKNPERSRRWARESFARVRAKQGYAEKIYYQIKARIMRDPHFGEMRLLRRKLSGFLYNPDKDAAMELLIGCTGEGLRVHLEKQFAPGMTWGNRGRFGWHCDHRLPLSSFDLRDPEELKKAWHYSNLQPLWWRDNLSKGSKLPPCPTVQITAP